LVRPKKPHQATPEGSLLFRGTAALDNNRLVSARFAVGDGRDHHPRPLDCSVYPRTLQKACCACCVAGVGVG